MFQKGESRREVRPSPIAGQWYPGTGEALAAMVDGFLANVPAQQLDGQVVGLLAPHAGYPFSGQVAAYAYKQVQGQHFDRVVVLGPSHIPYPGAFLVTDHRYYATPLGRIEVDEATIDRLAEHVRLAKIEFDEEHSLEIQLPFLQRAVGEFRLVPIMMRDQSWEDCQQLAAALDEVLGPERPLVVASSDLCHAYSYQQVRATDAATLAALERGDPLAFWQTAYRGEGACGFGPITTLLLLGQRWGANRVVVLQATNSGDVTGQKSGYVVGYAAAAVVAPA